MAYAMRLKIMIRAFLALGCFFLLSCTTMNTNTADKPTTPETKSVVKVSPVLDPPKTENASSDKNQVSSEKNQVTSTSLPKATISDVNNKLPSRDVGQSKPQPSLQVNKPITETQLLPQNKPEDKIDDPLFSSNTDDALYVAPDSKEEEKEKDVMEEALVLLDESQNHWVKGELDDALQMLDQAYALLLDTNGNPEIARQKDDLRLIIAKKILAIYNSIQSPAKGMRGEIPLITNADVEKEIRSFQTIERDFFVSSYHRSTIYRPVISNELKEAGLPDELSWLPLVESGFKINALSPARALGLWQFIPSTGYKYGLNRDYWIDERMDLEKSTKAALAYLRDLHAMFGDWLTVLAGYNCGEGRVMQTISSQHINYLDRFWDLYQRLPNETARYVPRFLATLLIVKNPQTYGFDLASGQSKYVLSDYDTVETNRPLRLHDIAVKLEASEENLCLLNAELRYKTTPDKPYRLKVPRGSGDKLLQIVAEIPSAETPRASYQTVPGAFIKHKVRPRETLTSIAKKYNTSIDMIRSANKLSKKKGLYVGQRLKIPLRKTRAVASSGNNVPVKNVSFYKAKKGDSLSAISRKFDISIADLKKINNLKGNAIQIGQVLKIRSQDGKDEASVAKYQVQRGDNLTLIAKKKGVPLEKLLTLNKMSLHDNIYPGQEIIIQ